MQQQNWLEISKSACFLYIYWTMTTICHKNSMIESQNGPSGVCRGIYSLTLISEVSMWSCFLFSL